jgi:hypothetical protein
MPKSDGDIGALKSLHTNGLDDSPGILVQTGDTLLYAIDLTNGVAAITYIQCFNKAALSDVTLGTTTPDAVFSIAASATDMKHFPKPIKFDKGLCVFSTNSSTGATGAASHCTWLYA